LPFAAGVALGLLASGGHAERAGNLATKFEEGLLRPAPGCWDVLEFVHGPFQQLYPCAAELLFLARRDAPEQAEALDRLRALLPAHHHLHLLHAELDGPFALLDHELLCNALVLRAMAEQGVEPGDWPGRGLDSPLYDLAPPADPPLDVSAPARGSDARALGRATSPEVAEALAAGRTTAVLALGSTEQHGAHLPLETDTAIGEALAARFCARLPAAQQCPTLALGCASEHLGFPGTLSLAPETLESILGNVAKSLSHHGFRELFIFTAHGGNAAALRGMAARLAARAGALEVIVFADQQAVGEACAAAAARNGVTRDAAGQHAGEFETSIMAALSPGCVRAPLEAGLLDVPQDAQSIFYPDLRAHAPSGVVGDPRGAEPGRADSYLEAWVDVLVAGYRAAKKRHQMKGTQNE
jgi:creatinine amidohydrolase